jgi:hypothetical protein
MQKFATDGKCARNGQVIRTTTSSTCSFSWSSVISMNINSIHMAAQQVQNHNLDGIIWRR